MAFSLKGFSEGFGNGVNLGIKMDQQARERKKYQQEDEADAELKKFGEELRGSIQQAQPSIPVEQGQEQTQAGPAGGATVAQPEPSYASKHDYADLYKRMEMAAASNPQAAAKFAPMLDMAKKLHVGQSMKEFGGDLDTRSGQIAYQKHYLDSLEKLGGARSPEQIQQINDQYEKYSKEGYERGLELLDQGRIKEAEKAFNSVGNERVKILGYEEAQSDPLGTGRPMKTIRAKIDFGDGSPRLVDSFAARLQAEDLKTRHAYLPKGKEGDDSDAKWRRREAMKSVADIRKSAASGEITKEQAQAQIDAAMETFGIKTQKPEKVAVSQGDVLLAKLRTKNKGAPDADKKETTPSKEPVKSEDIRKYRKGGSDAASTITMIKDGTIDSWRKQGFDVEGFIDDAINSGATAQEGKFLREYANKHLRKEKR